jgi:hypothetical protein
MHSICKWARTLSQESKEYRVSKSFHSGDARKITFDKSKDLENHEREVIVTGNDSVLSFEDYVWLLSIQRRRLTSSISAAFTSHALWIACRNSPRSGNRQVFASHNEIAATLHKISTFFGLSRPLYFLPESAAILYRQRSSEDSLLIFNNKFVWNKANKDKPSLHQSFSRSLLIPEWSLLNSITKWIDTVC